VPLYFCPYLCQLSTDFHNSVSALPCEISIKYAYITIITNKHFGKIEKKQLQTNIVVNGMYDTKLCWSTQPSVIQIIHRIAGLKCFFHLPSFCVIIASFVYIYISQGSVKRIYRVVGYIIITLPQIVCRVCQ